MLAPIFLAEISARLYYSFKERGFLKRSVRYTYLPYVGYFPQPFSQPKNNLYADKHGFIHNGWDADRDLREKPSDEFRIFTLGGSTGARGPEDTWASRLERELLERFKREGIALRPHVINAGVSSYRSIQEAFLYQRVVLNLGPDYALFMDGAILRAVIMSTIPPSWG